MADGTKAGMGCPAEHRGVPAERLEFIREEEGVGRWSKCRDCGMPVLDFESDSGRRLRVDGALPSWEAVRKGGAGHGD